MALALRSPRAALCLPALLALACAGREPELRVVPLREIEHPGVLHQLHVSEPSLAAAPDGALQLAWIRRDAEGPQVWTLRLDADAPGPVRVDPPGTAVASGHQAPGLAVAPDAAVHVSWSSARPAAESPFASDLRLSTSRDGGKSFGPPLRVSADLPGARGFEGIAVDAGGGVVLAWIESSEGSAATLVARIGAGGETTLPPARLGARTCPCCRIGVAAGPGAHVGVLWRDELPGAVRDMVLARSEDGGRSFAAPQLVHADGWRLPACPHRGGALAFDAQGGALAAWYTEGERRSPELRLARAEAGGGFGPPRRVHELAGSLPDRVALALRPDGTGLLVWESVTPVRSEIAARAVRDGGRRLGPTRVLSRAVKATGPALALRPGGDFAVAWNEERFPALVTVVGVVSVAGE
jgi:hypothetical protein